MNTASLVVDGLWQCLCPSFTRQTLLASRSALPLVHQRRRPVPQCLREGKTTTRSTASQIRQFGSIRYHRAAYNPISVDATPEAQAAARASMPTFASVDNYLEKLPMAHDHPHANAKFTRRNTGLRRVLDATTKDLWRESIPELYDKARVSAANANYQTTMQLVTHLVRDRKEQPNLRLYGIAILANVNAAYGAAWRVAEIVKEMFDEGIEPDAGICHDILKVLSVHIDYLFRADILEHMSQRWMTLTENGHHDVCAALLREGQLEMAVAKLAQMRSDRYIIQPWLYDLAIYLLSENGEYVEALRLINERIDSGETYVSRGIWLNLLDNASANCNHEATAACWKAQVKYGFINPSSGLCLNVLTTAARAGDAALATDVFHVLSKRSTVFTRLHYELLLETYLAAAKPDLRAALTVLTIMLAAKVEPTPISTRPIYQYIIQDPARAIQAFDILVSLREQHRRVPAAALNVIIEAHVEKRDLEKAIIVYKAMHTFEPANMLQAEHISETRKPLANVETFNLLLRGTYRIPSGPDNKTAWFFASEMLAMGIRPDAITYDRLILVSLRAEFYHDAVRYLEEMTAVGFVPRFPTVTTLAKKLARMADARCWDVLERVGALEKGIEQLKVDIEHVWRIAVRKKEDEEKESWHLRTE